MMIESDYSYQVNEITHKRRLSTVYFTAWFIVFLGAAWMLLGFFIGYWQISLTSFIAVLGSVIAIILIYSRFHILARSIWMISGQLSVFVGCFLIDDSGNVNFMFAAMVGGPFLIFSLLTERFYIALFVGLDIVLWSVHWYLGSDYFGTVIVSAQTAQSYFELPAALTTMAVILIELGYFAFLLNLYSEKIYKSNVRAKNAVAAKSAFLANMSHEIRTPMNGVVGLVDVLDQGKLNDYQRKLLSTIRDSANSLLQIIDDILDTSKIEAGQLKLDTKQERLLDVFEGVLRTLSVFASEKNVMLYFQYDAHLPNTLVLDSGRLRQVILNLMSNAIKFSTPNKKNSMGYCILAVRKTPENQLCFEVQDNGIGISKQAQETIFDPFVQDGNVKLNTIAGTGLGLAIVRELVLAMDGKISLESELGKGSTFRVDLPIVEPVYSAPKEGFKDMNAVIEIADSQTASIINYYLNIAGMNIIDAKNDIQADLFVRDNIASLKDDAKLTLTKVSTNLRDQETVYVSTHPMYFSEFCGQLMALFDLKIIEQIENKPAIDLGDSKTVLADLKILVAEDNSINQIVMKAQLEQIGANFEMVNDGEQALRKCETGEFDLVLCDCEMPKVDGFEFTRMLRDREQAEGTKRIAVIAITANAMADQLKECIDAGMDDYLSKPIKLDKLNEILQTWAEKKPSS